jgi:Leucine-rich repeat (LRR) protein
MSGFGLLWTPKFLAGMTGLTGLNLDDNHIDELYTVIPLVNTLTCLRALGNKIKYLPIEIGGRTSLKDLQVDQEIWDLCATELHLSASRHVRDYLRRILEGQESTSLKFDNMGLQQLPVIYANSDQLQTLPDSFGALTALTRVSLQKNKLHGVPLCVQKWSLLKDLVLADNEIVGLPVPVFEALKELSTLDCKNNKIHEVKGPLWMLPRLRILDVHGNNVSSPPMAFVNKGKR